MADTNVQANAGRTANLFIVGSMKCGTTILFDFLTSHAEIAGGDAKEIHFFSMHHDKGEAWYAERFKDSGPASYYLDASPTYFDMCLDVPTAERIRDHCPDAKIIILIRNPIERAASHFNHLKKINQLPVLQELTFDDIISRRWPPENAQQLEKIRHMLVDFSSYEEKIAKFVQVFGYENVMTVHNDDLRRAGDTVVRQIFDFLGLDAPEGVDFSQQLYKHGSENIKLSPENFFSLLEELGDDYYRACRVVNVQRPQASDPGHEFNQPVGALVGEVGVGEDGWLFLATGSNNALQMYLESDEDQHDICRRWHDIIKERAERFSSSGTRYYHVMLPEKMTALGEKLHWPINSKRSRGNTFSKIAPSGLKENIVDFIPYLLSLPDRESYFLKTDSHWNHRGAFLCYQLICSTLQFEIRNELIHRPKTEGTILFDLGVKLPDAPSEHAVFAQFRADARLLSDEGLVSYKRTNRLENEGSLHTGSFVQFENPDAPNKLRVVIFGDSFSEYRDHLLTALLAETFEHTTFVWSTSMDYSLCERIKPDVVFCLMTERFMARTPTDDFDLDEYVATKLAGLKA